MPSEKTRYLFADEMALPPAYLERLETAARLLSREDLVDTLLQAAEQDLLFQFRLAARLVPLSLDETVTLLQQALAYMRQGPTDLSARAQEALAGVADALIERGLAYAGDLRVAEAAAIGFAILVALEPQLDDVCDEGDVLQSIIADTFNYLASLPAACVPRDVFSALADTAETLLDGIAEEDRHYTDDWRIATLYRKRAGEAT
jgi:hypothetical protein